MEQNQTKPYEVWVAWEREDSEAANEGKLPKEKYDVHSFATEAEAQAYDKGIYDGNGWDEPYTEFHFPNQQPETPPAYILCYTLRYSAEYPKIMPTQDFWEVFAEYNESEDSPKEQAEKRLGELTQQYENNEEVELYTWNIAAITETNEWYETNKVR